MQYLILMALLAGMAGGVAALAYLGLAQRLRRGSLEQAAGQLGMMFSQTDLFALESRYGGFLLPSLGHSGRVENLVYGRYEGRYFRLFDYSFEIGHGPGRVLRRYGALVIETDLPLRDALLWHGGQAEYRPLAVQRPVASAGAWGVVAGPDMAEALVDAFGPMGQGPLGIEVRGGWVMLLCPRRWKGRQLAALVDLAAAGMRKLGSLAAA
jgi:hypothetical protein